MKKDCFTREQIENDDVAAAATAAATIINEVFIMNENEKCEKNKRNFLFWWIEPTT